MQITNKTHIICPECGIKANGFDDISENFGYKLVKGNVTPYTYCKACRSRLHPPEAHKKKRPHKQQNPYTPLSDHWDSAAGWGKKIHISKTKFGSYLIELGYLEYDFERDKKGRALVLTEKGKLHSAVTNAPFSEVILWDYDAFIDVVMQRAKKAETYSYCPKCKAHLDNLEKEDRLVFPVKCSKCGYVSEYCELRTIFDR